jgi:hypothetical protein
MKIEVPIPNNVHFTPRTLSGFIDTINKYKDHISCMYFPLGHIDTDIDVWGIRAPQFVYPNGNRDAQAVLNWENAVNQILSFTGLPVKVLMNNIYSPDFYKEESWAKILNKLEFYRKRYPVLAVTVSDVTIIPKLINEAVLVSLSTNSHTSLQELDMFLMMYGSACLDSVVLQRDLNRNPKKLQHYLSKHPELASKLILMVNEGCVNACIYKNSGDVEISLSDVKSGQNKIHVIGCENIARLTPWLFLTSQFLTKEILEMHYPFIDQIKLAGRNLGSSNIKYMLQHYVDGEDKDLSEFLNVSANDGLKISNLSEAYWRDVLSCNKECASCRQCETHYAQALSNIRSS